MSLRRGVTFFLKPIVKWYLKTGRRYTYKKIEVVVPAGVFHPGFFSSTIFLLEYLSEKDIKGKSLLELGCGSGLISVVSAKAGATVMATDLSRKAVEATSSNAKRNNVSIFALHANLFDQIPARTFDWIIINPPFYPREPKTEEELAWYCGEQFEYFQKLFSGLAAFSHPQTNALMVLSEDCDQNTIEAIAAKSGFKLEKVAEKKVFLFETQFLFLIRS